MLQKGGELIKEIKNEDKLPRLEFHFREHYKIL